MKKQYYELKTKIEKICSEAIQDQKNRERTLGYGHDDYTEGRIVGKAVLARKILKEIRSSQL